MILFFLLLFVYLCGIATPFLYFRVEDWLRDRHKSTVQIHDYDEQLGIVMQSPDGTVVPFKAEYVKGLEGTVTVAPVGEDGKPGEFREVTLPQEVK